MTFLESTWRNFLNMFLVCSFSAFEFLSLAGPPFVEDICNLDPVVLGWLKENPELCNRVKVEALYDRVVKEQAKEVLEIRRDEELGIPKDIDYLSKSLNLSFEEREKLIIIQPQTIAAATRIQGK